MTQPGNCLCVWRTQSPQGVCATTGDGKSPQLLAAETPIGLKIFLAFVGVIAIYQIASLALGRRKRQTLLYSGISSVEVTLAQSEGGRKAKRLDCMGTVLLPGKQVRASREYDQKLGWQQRVPPAKAREPYDNEVVKRWWT